MKPSRAWGIALALSIVLGSAITATTAASVPTPRGVHIGYGADPATEMAIVWHTRGTANAGSVVEYGATAELGTRITGSSSLSVGLPASLASRVHEALLQGLAPGSTTYYRVGDGISAWSPVRSFETATPGDTSQRFVIFGDHGTTPQSAATIDAVRALDPDFVLIAGDMSYANSRLERWDAWAELIEPLAAEVPLMVAPGNHETDPSQTPTPAAFLQRFALPDAEFYWSMDIGRVHVLALHSTVVAVTAQASAAQVPFAEDDLVQAAARRDAGELDRIIVLQHHPLYGSQDTTDTARTFNAPMIAWEEQLLHAADADLLVAGHNHHYERTAPVAYGQVATDPVDGFVEVITGGAGAGLYSFKESGIAAWSMVREKRFHVTLVEIEAGAMHVSAIATDAAGGVIDAFEVP